MQLSDADLHRSVEELAVSPCLLRWSDAQPLLRMCPQCPTVLTVCELDIDVDTQTVRSPFSLARCLTHGPWFDKHELTELFTAVERRMHAGRPRYPMAKRQLLPDD